MQFYVKNFLNQPEIKIIRYCPLWKFYPIWDTLGAHIPTNPIWKNPLWTFSMLVKVYYVG